METLDSLNIFRIMGSTKSKPEATPLITILGFLSSKAHKKLYNGGIFY